MIKLTIQQYGDLNEVLDNAKKNIKKIIGDTIEVSITIGDLVVDIKETSCKPKIVSKEAILEAIKQITGVELINEDGTINISRKREVVIARYVFFYYANKHKDKTTTLEEIGLFLKRDHSIVCHCLNNVIPIYLYSPTYTGAKKILEMVGEKL